MGLGGDSQPVCDGAELFPRQPHTEPFPDGSGPPGVCLFHAAELSEVSGPSKDHHDPTASLSAASCKGVRAGDSRVALPWHRSWHAHTPSAGHH